MFNVESKVSSDQPSVAPSPPANKRVLFAAVGVLLFCIVGAVSAGLLYYFSSPEPTLNLSQNIVSGQGASLETAPPLNPVIESGPPVQSPPTTDHLPLNLPDGKTMTAWDDDGNFEFEYSAFRHRVMKVRHKGTAFNKFTFFRVVPQLGSESPLVDLFQKDYIFRLRRGFNLPQFVNLYEYPVPKKLVFDVYGGQSEHEMTHISTIRVDWQPALAKREARITV